MAHVASCRFLRLDCSEDDHSLFRREYARTNRQRDVKLLRCFPHCCPKHIQRSYCGCSVHVLVTFSTAAPLSNVVVCARFEPSRVAPLWPVNLGVASGVGGSDGSDDKRRENERRLEVGESVCLPPHALGMAPDARSSEEIAAVWIRAEREAETKQQAFPKNSVLYVINNVKCPKWLYGYDSSLTRTHREMTHHLVAYVFTTSVEQTQQQGHANASVLARHASPGFLLVSYRRSDASNNPGCLQPAVHKPSDNSNDAAPGKWFVSSKDLLSASRIVMGQQQRQPQLYIKRPPEVPSGGNTKRAAEDRRRNSDDSHRRFEKTDDTREPARHEDSFDVSSEDATLWQFEPKAREHGFREKGQHLLVLWRFLQHVSLDDLDLEVDSINTHVGTHWLRAAAALRAPLSRPCNELGSVVISFLASVFGASTPRQLSKQDTVARAVAYLFTRAASSRSVQNLLHSALAPDLVREMNHRQLRTRFVELVSDLYDVLNEVLREISYPHSTRSEANGRPYGSLEDLVDEVLSLAYSHTRFGILRPEMSALLLRRQKSPDTLLEALNNGYYMFCRQARGSTTRSEDRQSWLQPPPFARGNRLPNASSVVGTLGSLWSQRWLFVPDSLSMKNVTSNTSTKLLEGLRVVDVVQFFKEFGCIDMAFTSGGTKMSLRSVLPFSAGTATADMELTLDGRLRVFEELPSGVSSSIGTAGGWGIGDYVAKFSHDMNSFSLDLFATGLAADSMPGAASSANPDVSMRRRVSLSFTLNDGSATNLNSSSSVSDRFMFVRGIMSGVSPWTTRSDQDRETHWLDVHWTPLLEFHGGYVEVRTVGQ